MSDPYLRDIPPHRLTDEEIEGFANMCDSRNSTLYREIRALQADLAAEKDARVALEVRRDATTWESDHQRLKLQEVGLADEFEAWGCDAIEHVAAALIAVRKQRDADKAARERAEKEAQQFKAWREEDEKRAEKAEAERDAVQTNLDAWRPVVNAAIKWAEPIPDNGVWQSELIAAVRALPRLLAALSAAREQAEKDLQSQVSDCPNCAAMREALRNLIWWSSEPWPQKFDRAHADAVEVFNSDAGAALLARLEAAEKECINLRATMAEVEKFAAERARGEGGT